MATTAVAAPKVTTREEWTKVRKALLEEEKALTHRYDAVNAQRRRLPMVKVDKLYEFDGPDGKLSLRELFEGQRQLIVYHFMFDPEWEKGCPGCTSFVDAQGDLEMLGKRNTRMVLVSRAPLSKLEKYKHERGWEMPWYSSFGSDFNYDYHVTQDKAVVPLEYNFRDQAEMESRQGEPWFVKGETHGLSVFFRVDDDVYHTYSTYARGCESLTDAYRLLDLTPYGRQEDFEDSPTGWPQKPTYGE